MTGAHSLISTTNYSYSQGLFDFPTREFRGFGQVAETRADGSKVIHYYYQDEAKKGKEYLTEINDAANAPFAKTENTWDCQQLYPLSPTCVIMGDVSKIVYVSNLRQTDNYTFDGVAASAKITSKQYQNYDAYGNVGLQIDLGDTSISGDEVYTYSEFWTNCASGINDRVGRTYVTAVPNGTKLREKFLTYDGVSACPTKGNLTKEEVWLNTGSNPITYYEYDFYGNRTKTTDPEGRITQAVYDTTYHTFPEKIYNAKNQLTTTYFNAVNGQPTQVIDPNGFATTYAYDIFKRKMREVKPYDSDASPTVSIQYVMDGIPPESVIVYKKDGTPTFDTVQFVDGFGNLIQTKAGYESNMNKTVVDVFYDEMGRAKKQSNPYLTDSTLAYSPPDVIAPGTGYTYDPLGRPIQIQNPDSTQINRTFDHWNVTETDENGHAKSYTFDASQRLKQVVENNSGSSYITNYIYSPLGELTNITDHSGNVTTIVYDSLGRKTQMNDPDMSTWVYAYDRVGNLVSQTDAKGITTNIAYDPLNRKTFIDYPSSADIQFTYDTGTIGTLSQVVDAAGTVNYYYDQRLRKSREDRTIDGNTFSTLWAYDSMDRVTSQTYPDGQTVTFNYNAQGKLDNIPGIITGIDYNAGGQVTQKNYANGKSTTYAYHPSNLRLTSLATSGIQNFTYTYDNVGNIKSIADGLSGKTENFGYDDLDRLTGAGDGTYGIQYQYNPIGNMLSMTKNSKLTQFTYGAGAAIPHAVTGMTIPIPVVGSFVINKGDAYTTTNVVTLDNISAGNPTYYMASEDKTFAGTAWQTYSTAPSFLLSAGFGIKSVYFKAMNMEGESAVKSDTIELRLNPADAYRDSDGDGVTDMMEYIYGTNPYKKDTDGDGKSDYAEIYSGISDPRKKDTDGDGLDDQKDPYPESKYHKSFSENYGILAMFNEGGNSRSSTSYKVRDSLGSGFGKETASVQSHPELSVSPALVDFKTVKIGESSTINMTLSNRGMGGLILGTLSFNGTNAGEFSKQNDTCSGKTIISTGACTMGIVFSPVSTGPKNAKLSISSNAPNTPTLDVSLNGAGTNNDLAPNISVAPTAHNFGKIGVNKTSPIQTFTISNLGVTNLQVNFIDRSMFNITTGGSNPCPSLTPTIIQNGNCTIVATFTPTSTGDKSTTLRLTSFDPDTPTFDIPLSGTSVSVNDAIPPTSAITIPTNGMSIFTNEYTIRGTASDGAGSGIQKVEISTDGGLTWNLATGTTSWSYVWTIPGVGTYTIKSRATDNAGNVETPGVGLTVTVAFRQPTLVTISGREFLVSGQPFITKGVGYAPTPIGDDPETTPPYGDYFTSNYNNIYDRDFPLLRDMGANTIRLWGWNNTADHLDFLDKAYNGGVNPIYVIAGYWINAGLDIDPNSLNNVREQLKAEFREMVSIHKNHPAILMWAIGNELNASWMYGGNLTNLFSLINEMSEEAHAEDANHPVTTPQQLIMHLPHHLMYGVQTFTEGIPLAHFLTSMKLSVRSLL